MTRIHTTLFAGVAVSFAAVAIFPSCAQAQLASGTNAFVNGEIQFLYTNSIGMRFVEIPPGSFIMGHYQPGCPDKQPLLPRRARVAVVGGGSGGFGPGGLPPPPPGAAPPAGAPGAGPPALPWTDAQYALCRTKADAAYREGFIVSIKQGYMLGQHEVTQAQYTRVMGVNPSYWQGDHVPPGANTSQNPVDSVSWADAQAFVAKLNAIEGKELYWLPTEAEWEWAARAGQEWHGLWSALDPRAVEYGWFYEAGMLRTSPAGGKKPNPWGLHDMLGNVWEWTADVYNNQYLAAPQPVTGSNHVIKGGSFLDEAHSTTVFDHQGGPGSVKNVGFRIARKLVP